MIRSRLTLTAVAATILAHLVGTPPPVRAAMAPDQSWTQENQGDWPSDNSHPDCNEVFTYKAPDGNTYGHGPCIQWARDLTGVKWAYNGNSSTNGDSWHSEISAAMSELNQLPYRSPRFVEAQPCALCINEDHEGTTSCGWEFSSWSGSGNGIDHATVHLNIDLQWVITGSTSGSRPCNLRSSLLHELVHALAEGHSSKASDLMAPRPPCDSCWVEQIDTDARLALNVIYGPTPPPDPSCAPVVLFLPLDGGGGPKCK